VLSLFRYGLYDVGDVRPAVTDRLSGVRVLLVLFGAIAICNFSFAVFMPAVAGGTTLLLMVYVCFGLGNGATFQLVPHAANSMKSGKRFSAPRDVKKP
jgi:nitrate/nitrite transporter NarK